ncbi:pilus assembly protein [Enteractinococcus fodinae]|uniref:Flp pilus assembly protein TadG n=1 Tax=Enteractinococcus fodinae TaxID=684663 RepID=A0ABU2B019_9MICC|nr:pilus assembly protein [Enteractinococcus fodinae]MDR7346751.1 Flp pilus assembly protein TadG [Enteractinococcus fodinae]
MRRREDDGAIVAESAMIIALVTLLCGTILQVGVIIHTKNTLIDVASAGARHAALADRNLAEGQDRTAMLLAEAIPNSGNAHIQVARESDGERITVTVSHRVPLFGFLTGPIPLSATAQAYDLTPQ